jgi:hypothetical protein
MLPLSCQDSMHARQIVSCAWDHTTPAYALCVLTSHCVCHPQHSSGNDPWCKFNDHMLQLFTSCLFLAGGFAALVGSWTCKR